MEVFADIVYCSAREGGAQRAVDDRYDTSYQDEGFLSHRPIIGIIWVSIAKRYHRLLRPWLLAILALLFSIESVAPFPWCYRSGFGPSFRGKAVFNGIFPPAMAGLRICGRLSILPQF